MQEDGFNEELSPAYQVLRPAQLTVPFVFNSPHSGRVYSQAFLDVSRLDPLALRKSEDTFVDELFEPVVAHGAPLMHALFPRAYLDLNREPYELDPALITDALPQYANSQTVRVMGGLGTIPRVVADQEEIYRKPLGLREALKRIDRLHLPYHAQLAELINGSHRAFGFAVLIDCHSMPSNPTTEHSGPRPDFVLGDRFGTSCDSELPRFISKQLSAMGYEVAINKPYAGGYITEHYGRPADGVHTLQIEINRALYLDEPTYKKSRRFSALRADLETMVQALFGLAPSLAEIPRWAAE
jgi:N-formylglutamate amidohydrolase